MQSFHRGYVAFNWLNQAATLYGKGLGLYVESMEKSLEDHGNVNPGLSAASSAIDRKVALINEVLTQDLRPNLTAIVNDRHIDASAREHIQELWSVYQDMKDLFDRPRGNLTGCRAAVANLKDRHRRHAEPLKLVFGVED